MKNKYRGIPFIKIETKNNYEFGYKLGLKLKNRIVDRIEVNKRDYKKIAFNVKDFNNLITKSEKFLPSIKKCFPKILDEAKAMADGADISFQDLFVLMCEEEIVDFKTLHCTSVAIKTINGKFLLGNNEDWIPHYRRNGLMLVKGKIKDVKFLGLNYVGSLSGSSCGLNNYGVSYSDNSFALNKFVYGVPRSFHLRALLEAKNVKESIRILTTKPSINSNTMLVNSEGITSVESYFNHHDIYKSNNTFVLANHPIEEKNRYKIIKDSIKRYDRALKILKEENELTINSVKRVLKDHKGKICEHDSRKQKNSSSPTIASVIMNPKDKWMMLCQGNPCKGVYKKYKL